MDIFCKTPQWKIHYESFARLSPERRYDSYRGIMRALADDQPKLLEVLKALGSSGLGLRGERNGKTLLHQAAILGLVEVATYLVSRGFDVDTQAYLASPKVRTRREKLSLGWSPLFYAVRYNHPNMVRYLLEAGARVHGIYSGLGHTAFEITVAFKREEIFWIFVEFGMTHLGSGWESRWTKHWNNADIDDVIMLRDRIAPDFLSHSATTLKPSPVTIIQHLQTSIRKAILPGGWDLQSSQYCDTCWLGRTDPKSADRFLRREQNLELWGCHSQSFNLGFIQRCLLCRAHLLPPSIQEIIKSYADNPIFTEHYIHTSPGPLDVDLSILLPFIKLRDVSFNSTPGKLLLPMYWLLRCVKGHDMCKIEDENPTLPTRVIYLGNRDTDLEPRLYESKPREQGAYCTLSYRWPKNPVTTTRQNVFAFQERIPLQELPKTIQDAMNIAKWLGFQYIWIDSLCIIQDSDEDWKAESTKMHSIYHCSSLTICAAEEDSPNGILNFQWEFRHEHKYRDGIAPRSSRPLDTRGWVLQEQVLSRRVLTYSSEGIFWTCGEAMCSTKYPGGMRLSIATRESRINPDLSEMRERLLMEFRDILLSPKRSYSTRFTYSRWQRIIMEYTARHLTKETDRLVAVTGIGTLLANRINDKLIAGLWRDALPCHMLWRSKVVALSLPLEESNNGTVSLQHYELPQRPKMFKAPTWSWASVLGPITYNAIECKGSDLWPRGTFDTLVKVLVVHKESVLTLRAPIIKVEPCKPPSDVPFRISRYPIGFQFWFDSLACSPPGVAQALYGARFCGFYPDVAESWPQELFCLVVDEDVGVCLKRHGSIQNCFERVGLLAWDTGLSHDSSEPGKTCKSHHYLVSSGLLQGLEQTVHLV